MKHVKDIVVVGAGPTGMAAALQAAAQGFSVALIAPEGTHVDDDGRTTALMMPAVEMLATFGVWDQLKDNTAPLKTLRIIDDTNRLLRAPTVDFHAREVGEEAFGYNIPNQVLNAALASAVEANSRIETIRTMASAFAYDEDASTVYLEDGRELSCKLVVGADGVQSLARKAAGIQVRQWSYPQTALVLAFDHSRPHEFTSNEFHTREGPFTQVPLPGHRSSLVWVMRPEKIEKYKALAVDDLALVIERQMQSMLGKVSNIGRLQAWPLSSLVAERFADTRLMLIGQAAHAFPPIGAQGLNLGFRDIADLGEVLAQETDPGASRVTSAYARKRRADILLRTGAVDALNRSLLNGFLPVQLTRAAGMSLLRNIPLLRSAFMAEGMRPGSGLSVFRKSAKTG